MDSAEIFEALVEGVNDTVTCRIFMQGSDKSSVGEESLTTSRNVHSNVHAQTQCYVRDNSVKAWIRDDCAIYSDVTVLHAKLCCSSPLCLSAPWLICNMTSHQPFTLRFPLD